MTMNFNLGRKRRTTLSTPAMLSGVGLHSGAVSTVVISPGRHGIRIGDRGMFIALPDLEVERTPRCTRLRLASGRHLDMVEHLFAALRIAGITDVDIEVSGEEVPVLDGSARQWLSLFYGAGLTELEAPTEYLVATATVQFELGQSRYSVEPGGFHLECTIDFPIPFIGYQRVLVNEENLSSLASARTFAMEHEIAMLKANNLALGGSLENAVVVGSHGPLNPEGFRMPDECARHKALDFLGDLMVLGVPVIGRFNVNAPGHSANNAFVEAMIASGALRRVSVVETAFIAA
jgi:UDP-3-O-[3-hydroxymyristoyl] N-acetylglucosamine deacetylase